MESATEQGPRYLELLESGELDRRADELGEFLAGCKVCPHECGANRIGGQVGVCGASGLPIVASSQSHFGEEPFLVGSGGSGAIFLGLCNLSCVFCQNCDISQQIREGSEWIELSMEELAGTMLELQRAGCENINFVSPTHFTPQIVRALTIAARNGLRVPIVYNSNGYDRVEVLRLLDGIVDIYLPDLKYADSSKAQEFSLVSGYVEIARAAIGEMYRQVGSELQISPSGTAKKGLIIRHLVMPNDISGTAETMKWIAEELDRSVTVNLMAQYHPANKAFRYPELNRRITREEYRAAVDAARAVGLKNVMVDEWML